MNKKLPEVRLFLRERLWDIIKEDLCAEHLCLQVFAELLHVMEGRRFNFLGEILGKRRAWVLVQRRQRKRIFFPPHCGIDKRNLRIKIMNS